MKQRAPNYCIWPAKNAAHTGKFRRYSFEMERKSALKRAKNPMPVFVRNALDERGLMEAYLDRPPYQQNDYLGWISRAKLEASVVHRY